MLGLDEAAAFFGGSMTGASTCRRVVRQIIHAVRIAFNRWLFEARPALNMSCQDKGMPSRAARGDWKLGRTVIGERYGARNAW